MVDYEQPKTSKVTIRIFRATVIFLIFGVTLSIAGYVLASPHGWPRAIAVLSAPAAELAIRINPESDYYFIVFAIVVQWTIVGAVIDALRFGIHFAAEEKKREKKRNG